MWTPLCLDVPYVSVLIPWSACVPASPLIRIRSAPRVGHDVLPCLRPCPRRLSCGHKCSGNCTDKCSCAEKCRSFNLRHAEQQLAELQLDGDARQAHSIGSSSGYASQSSAPARNTSPEKWQQFSRDPRAHDEVIRQARLREIAEQAARSQPLISLGHSGTTIDDSSVGMAPEGIQEKFIFVENQNGRRILGGTQDISPVGGSVQRDGRAHKQGRHEARQQARRQSYRNEAQGPNHSGQGRQSASKQHRQLGSNETPQQQPQVHVVPSGIRQIGSKQQRTTQEQSYGRSSLQHQSAYNANADEMLPDTLLTTQGLNHFSDSNIDGSDIGFEAEVLGIRRGHKTQVDTKALRERSQHHMLRVHQEEPLINFGDMDDVVPRVEAGSKESNTSKGSDKDDEPELLIDI